MLIHFTAVCNKNCGRSIFLPARRWQDESCADVCLCIFKAFIDELLRRKIKSSVRLSCPKKEAESNWGPGD